MSKIDLTKYGEFVFELASPPSKDLDTFIERLEELRDNYDPDVQGYGPQINVPLLLVSGVGMGSEGGEFSELVKKIFFHGKKLDEALLHHLKRELGDVIWYWVNACNALGLDPNAVIAENVTKLESRHPQGTFDVTYMTNRKKEDL